MAAGKPVFMIGGIDLTNLVDWDGMKITRNDLDADGSGRNVLDGLMYRSKIATKIKIVVSFVRLSETEMKRVEDALGNSDYVSVTIRNPRTMTDSTITCYCSTVNEGVQRWVNTRFPRSGTYTGETVYDGVTFDLIER